MEYILLSMDSSHCGMERNERADTAAKETAKGGKNSDSKMD